MINRIEFAVDKYFAVDGMVQLNMHNTGERGMMMMNSDSEYKHSFFKLWFTLRLLSNIFHAVMIATSN